MKIIKCVIVDDEPLALDLLERYITKTPFLELQARCSSAVEATEVLQENSADLLFLDIQMPDFTGMEFSKTLKPEMRIIFTTAYNEYALEGYRVNALDYLLKPFDYDEFLEAALKAKEWYELKNLSFGERPEKDFIFVRSEYKMVKINLDEVLYFEGLKDYVKIWLVNNNQRFIMTIMSLKLLENELPSSKFMRVHRSYIVALDKIDAIERSQVLIHGTRITIAGRYKDKFQEFIGRKSLG